MRCKRCGGLMIVELGGDEDLAEQAAGRGALRCVNCGAMVNIRMLRNLAAQYTEGLAPVRQSVPRRRHTERRLTMKGDV
ncbi:hypothetical protein [Candidatus Nitrospira nitrificans]|uniref:Uncharacterized protein n=1 Tax=Candidatus Nitrospira nitrificans TaxID=1742973 RepID=A0A0S4LH27_9BACT|nr:hypothetical protein [Candidatus Nitrospira nitrificans]CUS35270.1 hypothetical protein COMA2_20178 [Candidatus Nitrospira nitrificans]